MSEEDKRAVGLMKFLLLCPPLFSAASLLASIALNKSLGIGDLVVAIPLFVFALIGAIITARYARWEWFGLRRAHILGLYVVSATVGLLVSAAAVFRWLPFR